MITASGTYTGNGSNPRNLTGIGFDPDVVLVKATNTQSAEIAFSSQTAGESKSFSNSQTHSGALALIADGFTVDSFGNTNQSGTTYHWFAAKMEAADSAVFTYTGDGTDNRNVGSFGFTPAFAMVFRGGAVSNRIVWRSDQHSGDSSQEVSNGSVADRIQALNSGSIQVGTLQNTNTAPYYVWVVAATAGIMTTTEYVGDGSDNRNIAHGLGATPILTLIQAQAATQNMAARFKDHAGDLSSNLPVTVTADSADWIQAVDGTNVQVGTDARVNVNTFVYTMVTFGQKEVATGAPALGGLVADGAGVAPPPQMRVASGTYTGNGVDNRAIVGVGFQPSVVMIKGVNQEMCVRTSTMAGDLTKPSLVSNQGLAANLIQSLDPTGFTLGTDAAVNNNGTTYYWIALGGSATACVVGTYTGNGGGSQGVTGAGFLPTLALVIPSNTEDPVFLTAEVDAAGATAENFDGAHGGNLIASLDANGFTAGSTRNTNTVTYHYVVLRDVVGVFDTFTYTGNGGNLHSVAIATGYTPQFALTKGDRSGEATLRFKDHVGDSSTSPSSSWGNYTDGIQAFELNGMKVGGDVWSNQNGTRYDGFWFVESLPLSAAGVSSLGELAVAGTAVMRPSASGAAALAELVAEGASSHPTASGAVALDGLAASGTVAQEHAASGIAALSELTAEGEAFSEQPLAEGEAFLPALVAEGVAGREVIATGAINLAELVASGTQGVVGVATLGLLTAFGAVLVSTPPIAGDTEPPASGAGGAGGAAGIGGADICLDIDLSLEDALTGVVTLIPQPVVLRLKARRRMITRTPSGYARATTLPGREVVIQWGESYLPVEDMATLRALFAGRVNIVLWREPDGTPIRMRTRRDSFKTRWSWAQPGFYEPLVLTLTEMP